VNCTLPTVGDTGFAPEAWASAVADRTRQLAELCERARATLTDGGAIVNVLGVEAQFAAPGRGARSVAESAAAMLTKTLGVAWAAEGIRVNGVAVPSGYHARAPRHPAGRLPTDREIAEAVAFLASPDAAYITAEILRVDCGWGAYQLF
jgi:3-oxoacyl-[acyl-carrier protein] reductase